MRKQCTKCHKVGAHYRDAGRRDGLDAVCKVCRADAQRAYRQANKVRNGSKKGCK